MSKMAEQLSEVDVVINSLSEIQSDTSVPRNVRTKMDFVIST